MTTSAAGNSDKDALGSSAAGQSPAVPPSPQGQRPPDYRDNSPAYRERPANGMAIASLIFGVVGLGGLLWFWGIGSILALIFGYIARSQIKRKGESGGGLAVAGIVLGWIGIGAVFLLFVVLRSL